MNQTSDTDWDTVTVLRKPKARAAEGRSKQNIEAARRAGAAIDTEKKCKKDCARCVS